MFGYTVMVVATHTDAERPDDFQSLGDRKWEWDVTLRDGRRFHVKGWHDYTGWDCQSGAEYIEVVSAEGYARSSVPEDYMTDGPWHGVQR